MDEKERRAHSRTSIVLAMAARLQSYIHRIRELHSIGMLTTKELETIVTEADDDMIEVCRQLTKET